MTDNLNFRPMPNKLADRLAAGWVKKPGQGWVYDPDYKPEPKPEPKPKTVVITQPDTKRPNWYKGMPCPNPAGKPRGIKQRKEKVTQMLLDELGDIMLAMVDKAKEGDSAAAAIVVNRVMPTLRPQSEKVEFTIDADQPVSKQMEQVLSAIGKGEVAPDVGLKIVQAIQALSQTRTIEELEQKVLVLEGKAVDAYN